MVGNVAEYGNNIAPRIYQIESSGFKLVCHVILFSKLPVGNYPEPNFSALITSSRVREDERFEALRFGGIFTAPRSLVVGLNEQILVNAFLVAGTRS